MPGLFFYEIVSFEGERNANNTFCGWKKAMLITYDYEDDSLSCKSQRKEFKVESQFPFYSTHSLSFKRFSVLLDAIGIDLKWCFQL